MSKTLRYQEYPAARGHQQHSGFFVRSGLRLQNLRVDRSIAKHLQAFVVQTRGEVSFRQQQRLGCDVGQAQCLLLRERTFPGQQNQNRFLKQELGYQVDLFNGGTQETDINRLIPQSIALIAGEDVLALNFH